MSSGKMNHPGILLYWFEKEGGIGVAVSPGGQIPGPSLASPQLSGCDGIRSPMICLLARVCVCKSQDGEWPPPENCRRKP